MKMVELRNELGRIDKWYARARQNGLLYVRVEVVITIDDVLRAVGRREDTLSGTSSHSLWWTWIEKEWYRVLCMTTRVKEGKSHICQEVKRKESYTYRVGWWQTIVTASTNVVTWLFKDGTSLENINVLLSHWYYLLASEPKGMVNA